MYLRAMWEARSTSARCARSLVSIRSAARAKDVASLRPNAAVFTRAPPPPAAALARPTAASSRSPPPPPPPLPCRASGEFCDGRWHGHGTFCDARDGAVYDGLWHHGARRGAAVESLPNGHRREGVVVVDEDEEEGEGEVLDGAEYAAGGAMVARGRWRDGVFQMHTLPQISLELSLGSLMPSWLTTSASAATAAPPASAAPPSSAAPPPPSRRPSGVLRL